MSVLDSEVRVAPSLVAGARQAAEQAAKFALAADRQRRLDPSVAEALVAAGFARHFVPVRWGGTAGSACEAVEALATVGEGCMSAAWSAGVLLALGRMCSNLPLEAQEEVWGDGPDVPMAGSVVPTGTVEKVPGGWRLTGCWPYATGVDYAAWTTVGALDTSGDEPVFRHFLLPRSDYTVRDTWFNVGLRGTGSNSVEVDGAFVPSHRSFTHNQVLSGSSDPSAPACHRMPYKLLNGIMFVAPGIGAVRGALREWIQWTATRVEANRTATAERPSVRLAIAAAGAMLDSATMLVQRAAQVVDRGEFSPELPLRSSRDFTAAADMLLDATNRLFRVSGTHGQAETNTIQRVWRDVHCMAGHGALQPDQNADGWARHMLAGKS